MKILKFGGSSVATSERIKQIHSIVQPRVDAGEKVALVFSAFGGVTNQLIEMLETASLGKDSYKDVFIDCKKRHSDCLQDLFKPDSPVFDEVEVLFKKLFNVLKGVFLLKEASGRSYDYVMSFGERLSNTIIARYLNENDVEAAYLDARKVIKTNSDFRSASVHRDPTIDLIKNHFAVSGNTIQIITGFIASDELGRTTTLGRGGSDFTASIFAASLMADSLEIWTDVDGVLTCNPNQVSKAFSIPSLSYNEAMELSHFGAKVIYPPTIQPVFSRNIPLYIKNTFNPDHPGTMIGSDTKELNGSSIKGITSMDDISLITVSGSGLHGEPGSAARLFGCLAKDKINVILITQASSEHSICFAVKQGHAERAKVAIEEEFKKEIQEEKVNPALIQNDIAILAVVGEAMKNQPGISGKIFSALGRNGVNVEAVAQGSSELNISFAVKKIDENKALNLIHDSFFHNTSKTLHLYLVGTGLIGGTLLGQMNEFKETLLQEKGLELKIVGISNSRKMHFDKNGIDLNKWKERLANGEDTNPEAYIHKMIALNLSNSVFIDNTASGIFPALYSIILENNISISTPNKVASSSSFEIYENLKSIAKKKNTKFLFETNVGAGLPVISTIQTLRNSGDQITNIEAVVSGSISYIFNKYSEKISFHDIVKEAQQKGLTEPDPRDDLSGLDVQRKITILARESGYKINLEDVKMDAILPQSCLDAQSVEDFFQELLNNDSYFKELLNKANSENKRLRFIASLSDGKAKVGLQMVDETSPFYGLSESDNMIAFNTKRYTSSPLVIRGPGAGGDVTAAGVFAEIIQISNEVFSF